MKIEGIYTALVTPFKPAPLNAEAAAEVGIDEGLFSQIIERQIEAGVSGIIVGGSTGEGQSLSEHELKQAFKIASPFRGKVQIIGACGSSSTEETISKLKHIEDQGAEAVLVSSPPYNKPPQRGLIEHFQKIAASTRLPLIIYNIPSRTAVNILPITLKELWKIPNAIAIKESSGNWDQIQQIALEIPETKTLLSGDDPFNLPVFSIGGRGAVSVISNLAPRSLVHLWKSWLKKDLEAVRKTNASLQAFMPLLFVESNPIPVKWAMGEILKAELKPRLPLVSLETSVCERVREGLQKLLEFENSFRK